MPNFEREREIGARKGRTLTGESRRFGLLRLSDASAGVGRSKFEKDTEIRMTTRMRAIVALRAGRKG